MENQETKAHNKAEELITAMGWKGARIMCIQMNLEYFHFPNPDRASFWKAVTKKVEELSE